MKELAPSYDRDAETRSSEEESERAYKLVDEAVQPWLSPLEAQRLHDALYDMIYRVLMGDKLVQHKNDSDELAVENILKDIDLGV
jgi:phage portal protein BeeE